MPVVLQLCIQKNVLPLQYVHLHVGTASLVQMNFTTSAGVVESLSTACNKDTGGKQRLRMWSRGHLFIVRCCGHIDMWRPLYK